jgi:hypothetical protein
MVEWLTVTNTLAYNRQNKIKSFMKAFPGWRGLKIAWIVFVGKVIKEVTPDSLFHHNLHFSKSISFKK